ncbi:MAG: sugar ABC transporter substrate-binding protein [Caldilineaceae bacterium]|nr:sugar ABC transporter substrate-binding protein [Caldilineaceae bacterium]MBP8106532.1 sugar ABC transporter substrate-binding protein [Caldilineaceae bacterium]MBP9071411.1 sugar ABC transporter substrate-binding protein [Caldilineaceae bacterium]
MKKWSVLTLLLIVALVLGACAVAAPAAPAAAPAAEQPAAAPAEAPLLLGLVSITPSDSSNARFIKGATDAAEKLGWEVSVIDARGSADEANAAFQNLAQRGAGAIIDLVFPTTSLGAGLAAARAANIPVATWGGGLGDGVVATNGTGGPQATEVVKQMVAEMDGKGEILALTYHTGQVCREREEVLDAIVAEYPEITVTKNEVPIPGYIQAGAQFASAWLAGRPEGSANLAVWGCWDDPALGAISTLKQQNRPDVKVYGQNGNVDAIVAVQDGWMTATAWAAVEVEGQVMVETLVEAMAAGASWEPKAVEVPVIVVNKDTIAGFLADHPEAIDPNALQ